MTNERFTFLFYQFCFTLNKLYYIKGCCKDCQSCCKKTKKTCTKTILLCLFFFYIVLFQSFLSVTLHVKTSMAVLVLKKKKTVIRTIQIKKMGKVCLVFLNLVGLVFPIPYVVCLRPIISTFLFR